MLSLILTCALHLLLLLTIQPLQSINTHAYPITSSPIEWTAENWAWQAWARQTSEEQSKGKSRKVTPKSIFEIPYRNGCPPGHHSDGQRCIVTVKIDPTELLSQQVLAFVGDVKLEFDYAEETGSTNEGLGFDTQFNMYDAPQKFSSEMSSADKLPGQDEPLKFNFFEQKLETNENETIPMDVMFIDDDETAVESTAELSNSTLITNDQSANQTLSLITVNTINNNTNPWMELNNTINTDLLSESSNISTNQSNIENSELAQTNGIFSLHNIDAISLPANNPRRHPSLSQTEVGTELGKTSTTHKVSIYRGENTVQLITSASFLNDQQPKADVEQSENKSTQPELTEMFEVESLLPLVNMMTAKTTTTYSNEYDESSSEKDNDRSTLMPIVREDSERFEGDAADMIVTTKEKEKTDHIRSVSDSSLLSASELRAQDYEFTTTLEPDGTTSFQLDDTTIIEELNPPTDELQELPVKPATEQQEQVNVEKSKVKPVQNAFTSVDDYVMEETTTEIATSTLPPLPITPLQHQSQIIDEGVHIDGDANRFDYQLDIATIMHIPEQTTTIESAAHSEGIISDLMQAIAQTTTTTPTPIYISKTDLVALNNRKLTNNTSNTLQHNDKDSLLLTKADVSVNNSVDDDATTGEIVFVLANKQKTVETTPNIVMESLPTTTTPASIIKKENKTIHRITSKRWSKVMPIFDVSTMPTSQLVDETTTDFQRSTPQIANNMNSSVAITDSISTITTNSSISITEKRKPINRRNSKIIRLDKYPKFTNNNLSAITTIVSTDITTTSPPTTTESSNSSNNYIDPFWWLPMDWHLDRADKADGRPLLLRLWTSVTSDREAKV